MAQERDLPIDELLERYLYVLDRYQILRQHLTHHLSTGYLGIAQANFSNPHRIRYGQDFYDDRMQASVRCFIHETDPLFKVESATNMPPKKTDEIQAQAADLPTSKPEKATILDDEIQIETPSPASSRDPLRWFGILIPPALRDSQSSFKEAVTGDIPALVSAMSEMKELEISVRRARKRQKKANRKETKAID